MSAHSVSEMIDSLRRGIIQEQLESTATPPHRGLVKVKPGTHRTVVALLTRDFPGVSISTITGVDLGDVIELDYHMRYGGAILTIRTTVPAEVPEIETITDFIPGAALYEREVFDLLGVRFTNNPDLRRVLLPEDWPSDAHPLRKSWTPQISKSAAASRRTKRRSPDRKRSLSAAGSTTLNIVLGPQHPALHEPERFTFSVDDELVQGVETRLGFVHRGVEKAAEGMTYMQDVYLVERICGICNITHTTCFCQAAEAIAEIEIPDRSRYLRTTLAELNRIHSHLLLLGVAAHELGYESVFQYIWRDREPILDLVEIITGNRLITSFNKIGGVTRDLDREAASRVLNALKALREKMAFYKEVFESDPTLALRTKGVGVLHPSDAVKLCTVGPVSRGSGIAADVRKDDPYAAYGEIPFGVVTYRDCDSWARLMVRVDEVLQSIDIIEYAVGNLPDGPIQVRVPRTLPSGEFVSRVEAPRGELLHYVRSNGTAYPERVKIRSPTLANITSFGEMIGGHYIADIPAVLVSLDPCFSCTDRMAFVDHRRNRRWLWTLDQLSSMARRGGVHVS